METQQTLYDESTIFDTQIHTQMPNMNPDSMTNSDLAKALPSPKQSLIDYATPTANVSAFCCSVLSTIIPDDFWGEGDMQVHNKGLFMKTVDRFIHVRRFETVSLHDAIQGMKVSLNRVVGLLHLVRLYGFG